MNLVIIIALILSVLKIFGLKKRVNELEAHNLTNKLYSPGGSHTFGSDGSRVYVISEIQKKGA